MTIRPITITGEPVLHRRAEPVEVIDDGVGFDTDALKSKGEGHIGIHNVSYRLASMCKGEMKIDSHIGEGTKVAMIFPK